MVGCWPQITKQFALMFGPPDAESLQIYAGHMEGKQSDGNETFCADLIALSGRVNEAFVAQAIGSDHLPTVLDILL